MGRWRVAGALALVLVALPIPAQERSVRAVFVGDTGTGDSNQRQVAAQMARLLPPYVFLLGDNIYDRGDRRLFGERYDAIYSPLMARGSIFHSALGNHDVTYCDSAIRSPLPADREAYTWPRFRCDVEDHLAHAAFGYYGGRRYFSIVTEPGPNPLMEVFVLDSNTLNTSQTKLPLGREDQAQVGWLDAVLGASRARWKVVIMHHPPHAPTTGAKYFLFVPYGGGRAREYKLDVQLAPILQKHRVDAVIASHNHYYARMAPQAGIRYFVSGGGGRKVYPFVASPGYALAGGAFYHFLYVRATETAFEYYAIDERGVSRDAGWWAKGDAADRPFPAGTLPPAGR